MSFGTNHCPKQMGTARMIRILSLCWMAFIIKSLYSPHFLFTAKFWPSFCPQSKFLTMVVAPPRFLQRQFSASLLTKNTRDSVNSYSEIECSTPNKSKPKKSTKRVQFATVRTNAFKPKGKFKDLWWSADELRDIRAREHTLAKHVRTDRPLQDQALEVLSGPSSKGSASESKIVAASLKMIENTSIARGLERHTGDFLSKRIKAHQTRVLQAQHGCRTQKNAKRELYLKSVSARSSKGSVQLAQTLALLDYKAVYPSLQTKAATVERMSQSFTNRSTSAQPKMKRRLSSFW